MPQRPTRLSPQTKLAIKALEDLKGQAIDVLDVKKVTAVTDTMVLCTGTSSRHVKSLADNVIKEAKLAGETPLSVQGLDMGEWVIVDLNGVVVHVMQMQTRIHYQLEKLWDLAPEPAPKKVAPKKSTAKKPAKAAKGGKKPVAKKGKTAARPKKPAAAKKKPAKRR